MTLVSARWTFGKYNHVVRKEEIVKMVLRDMDEKVDPLAFVFCYLECSIGSSKSCYCVCDNLTLVVKKKWQWHLYWKLLWKVLFLNLERDVALTLDDHDQSLPGQSSPPLLLSLNDFRCVKSPSFTYLQFYDVSFFLIHTSHLQLIVFTTLTCLLIILCPQPLARCLFVHLLN